MVIPYADFPRQTSAHVTTADRHFYPLIERDRGSHGNLRKLSSGFSYRKMELVAYEPDDIVVEPIACDLQSFRNHRTVHRYHGDIARAAADIDNDARRRRTDQKPRTQGGRNR